MTCCTPFGPGALPTAAPYHWGAVASSGTTANRFFARTFGAVSTTEAQGQIVVPTARTFTSIIASFSATSPTDSITFTFRVGGVSSAIVLIVPATQAGGLATGFSVPVVAGARIGVLFNQSGTDTISTWNCSVAVF